MWHLYERRPDSGQPADLHCIISWAIGSLAIERTRRVLCNAVATGQLAQTCDLIRAAVEFETIRC